MQVAQRAANRSDTPKSASARSQRSLLSLTKRLKRLSEKFAFAFAINNKVFKHTGYADGDAAVGGVAGECQSERKYKNGARSIEQRSSDPSIQSQVLSWQRSSCITISTRQTHTHTHAL